MSERREQPPNARISDAPHRGRRRRLQPTRHAVGRTRPNWSALVTAAALTLTAALLIAGALIVPEQREVVVASGEAVSGSTGGYDQPRDANACRISFAGESVDVADSVQQKGALYSELPVPTHGGWIFAGWYADEAAAAAVDAGHRVNGSQLVACEQGERTLHAAWQTPEIVAAAEVHVPILMYHQFTSKPEGETNWLRLNYAYIGDFEQHIRYIAENGYYLPTWDELEAFIDGRLALPKKSVIVTDDDADQSWIDLAVPIVEQHQVLTTSFVITSARTEPSPGRFVLQRSHTHDMHRAGASGKGRMVNDSAATIAEDLENSAQILGAKQVVAYPFGHYNVTSEAGVQQAGFDLAVTTTGGTVKQGSDKLALPRVRIDYGMKLSTLQSLLPGD